MNFCLICRDLIRNYDSINLLDCGKLCLQLVQSKSAFLIIFQTVAEVQRCYSFVKKARENQLEIYKIGKYDIKINIDFYRLYSIKFGNLELDIMKVIKKIYSQTKGVNPVDKISRFSKFSMLFNNYMIAFTGATYMEQRYSSIFLKKFQDDYFERLLKRVIKNKMKRVF